MSKIIQWLKCFWNGHDYTAMKYVGRELHIGHTKNCINCGCKWPKGVDMNDWSKK